MSIVKEYDLFVSREGGTRIPRLNNTIPQNRKFQRRPSIQNFNLHHCRTVSFYRRIEANDHLQVRRRKPSFQSLPNPSIRPFPLQ